MRGSRKRMIAYFGIIALLSSLFMGLVGMSTHRTNVDVIKNHLLRDHVENNVNLAMKYLQSHYGTLQQIDGVLCDSHGNEIEGRTEMVDAILDDLGDRSTIFTKDKDDFRRISTSVESEEGNGRAVGTFLGTDHNAYSSVMKGELYVGEADILGDNYYTAYQPLIDNNDNIIGILFVGIPTETLDTIVEEHDEEMDKFNIWIVVLRTITLGILIALASTFLLSRGRAGDADKDTGSDDAQALHGENGELADAAESVQALRDELADLLEDTRGILKNISFFSREISDTSEHSSEQLKRLTEEIDEFMEEFES